MVERNNGKSHFIPRTHGTERRGVFSVPSRDYLTRLQQSQEDRERLLAALRERSTQQLTAKQEQQEVGRLGNRELPIFPYKQELLETIGAHKAVILEGPTGSGKSTQLPQYLYEAGYDHVFVLQGRRIMADGLGERLQEELTKQLGEREADNLVGIMHGERSQRHNNNKITVLTANTFIRLMPEIRKKFEDGRIAIIPDEIHEDDPNVEIAVGIAGMEVAEHDSWRLIGASATINAETVKRPFGRISNPESPLDAYVPVFRVEGRPFNVESHQLPDMNPVDAYLAVGDDHQVTIISTSGYGEIAAIINGIRMGLERSKHGSSETVRFREFSANTTTLQRSGIARLAASVPEGERLVVVATPAARSGITIPNATLAITDGMINREIRDEDGNWGLQKDYMTQAELTQVFGRVGRDTAGGIAYLCNPMPRETLPRRIEEHKALYPFVAIEDRLQYPTPAIYNTNISGMVLESADIGRDYSLLNKYTLHELDDAAVQNAKNRLRTSFGALENDGSISSLGRTMNKFPVVSELSRGVTEALRQGRTRQHMAHVALIAAAVDVGGLQEFRRNSGQEWKKLLRSGSDDDFIAQLDFMIALLDADKDSESARERFLFARAYDLNAKRAEDAKKLARKIMHRLGIDAKTLEVSAPSYEGIKALRDDFTAGMFDQVYRYAGMEGKEYLFTHIRDNQKVRHRTISERSVVEPARGQIIAGIPQYYQAVNKGQHEIKNIITMVLKVDPKTVGHFALQSGLIDYEPIKDSSRVNGGMVVERERIMYGSLSVGAREVSKSKDVIPLESQHALVRHVLQNPGPSQAALRSTADELSEYRRILPAEELDKYRRSDAPTDLTKMDIEKLLRNYAARTRNAQELDMLLGEHAYQKNISIDRYYPPAARVEMIERSPATIVVAGVETDIRYDNGNPYITKITSEQERMVTGPIYLEDGREVLRQVRKESGRGTRRISFSAA